MQSVYNLVNPSAGADAPIDFDMPNYGNLIGRASASGMGVLVIRVLAAGAPTGEGTRHPVAVSSVAPIGSGREYAQDLARANGFRWLQQEGYVESLVEASLRFALGNSGASSVLVGYSSQQHLEQAVEFARRGPLPAEAVERLAGVDRLHGMSVRGWGILRNARSFIIEPLKAVAETRSRCRPAASQTAVP